MQGTPESENLRDVRTDEELAAGSIRDPDVYAGLVDRYKDQLVNFLFANFVRDRSRAEDIAQDAFLKAYTHLDDFDVTKKFKTWLYKIAINTAYSFLRKPQPEDLENYIGILESDDSPEEYVDRQLQKERLEAALNCLEPRYKLVLDLYYKKDMSYEEIGTVLNVGLNTVKTRIYRAKQQLMVSFKGARA